MDWQRASDRLKTELELATEPVAVGFLGQLPEGAVRPAGKLSVCQALREASEGRAATLTADTCGCPGGLVNLGLAELPLEGKERLIDFLVRREQVYCSRTALRRSQDSIPLPLGLAPNVCFAPLAEASFQPDLVIFVGRPGSLHRLLGLADYWEGGPLEVDLAGPACRTLLAYPLATGNLGLSLLDFGARRLAGYAPDLMMVSVPLHRLLGILEALDSGVARPEDRGPEAAEREYEDLGPLRRAPR